MNEATKGLTPGTNSQLGLYWIYIIKLEETRLLRISTCCDMHETTTGLVPGKNSQKIKILFWEFQAL